MELVDIHCHILPDIDDGPRSFADALAMARAAVEQGITTVIATPHQCGAYAGNSPLAIREAVASFQDALRRRGIPLDILPGADVRIEADLPARLAADEVVTLADRRRYILLELPHDVFLSMEVLLKRLHAAGVIGILSHPERNRAIVTSPNLVAPLVESGCLMQITAGSLLGRFGSAARGCAEWLVERGLAHVVATDAHDPCHRHPDLHSAFNRLVTLGGAEVAETLCAINPARIVAAAPTLPAPRSRRRLIASLWPW